MKKQMIVSLLVLMMAAVTVGAQEKPALGILPFTGGSSVEGDSIASLFANSRELQQVFSIIPRTSVNTLIMREQQFQHLSGLTDSDTVADLGRQLNAKYVVSGITTSLGNTNLLSISILNVETMQQVTGDYERYARIEAIPGILPSMAQRIIRSIREQEAEGTGGATLAVLPLDIQDARVRQEDAEILAQILATEIANTRRYTVYPRTKAMETVLTEQHFQEKSGLTDRNTMAALRSATNARFVLAGTISRLGTTNLFDVKILDIETGRQVENGGAYRQYTNLADGIGLMGELAYELTGKEAGRYAENRQQERLAADAERTQWEAQRKQQNEENFKNAVAEFFFGEQRFTSLGVNAGIGFGQDENKNRNSNDPFYQNTETLNFNGFVNINATIPLVWYLFAEAGMDIGFAGSIGDRYYARYEGNQDDNKETFSLTRPYARLNIGIPFGDRDFLAFLYTGVGFGWTNASYQYMQDSYYDFDGGTSVPSSKQTTSIEYSAADLVFGCFVSWGHHGMRFSINLNNISKSEYFEMQMSAGYVFRF